MYLHNSSSPIHLHRAYKNTDQRRFSSILAWVVITFDNEKIFSFQNCFWRKLTKWKYVEASILAASRFGFGISFHKALTIPRSFQIIQVKSGIAKIKLLLKIKTKFPMLLAGFSTWAHECEARFTIRSSMSTKPTSKLLITFGSKIKRFD